MRDGIEPALTPEQWDVVTGLEDDVASVDAITFLEIVLGSAPPPLAAAAALLYDRATGFTWEDADLLWDEGDRLAAEHLRRSPGEADREMEARAQRYRSLAARIAALLPPRQTEDPGGALGPR